MLVDRKGVEADAVLVQGDLAPDDAGAAAIAVDKGAPAFAQQQTADLQELFRQVIMNPTDQAANLRYAKAAEQRGELRKALSAYERMVLNNPNDKQARAEYERVKALLEPPQTRYQFGFGGLWESNVNLSDGDKRDSQQEEQNSGHAGFLLYLNAKASAPPTRMAAPPIARMVVIDVPSSS